MTLPWYAAEKAEWGAYSSLLGLHLSALSRQSTLGVWRVTAVGDSCVFHTRGGCMLSAFPVDSAESFDNRPFLISSRRSDETEDLPIRNYTGSWQSGDCFYLMTDAAAQWFLRDSERGLAPVTLIERAFSAEVDAFWPWIEDLRAHDRLRNDDVTILRLLVT